MRVASIVATDGASALVVDATLSISCVSQTSASAALRGACERFLQRVRIKTGITEILTRPRDGAATIKVVVSGAAPVVQYNNVDLEYPTLGIDETYRLVATSTSVDIVAVTPFGAMHALETLLQLITAVRVSFRFIFFEKSFMNKFKHSHTLKHTGSHIVSHYAV